MAKRPRRRSLGLENDGGGGGETGLTSDDLVELKQLRKDKARLEMEVEILGKARAFFASRNR